MAFVCTCVQIGRLGCSMAEMSHGLICVGRVVAITPFCDKNQIGKEVKGSNSEKKS